MNAQIVREGDAYDRSRHGNDHRWYGVSGAEESTLQNDLQAHEDLRESQNHEILAGDCYDLGIGDKKGSYILKVKAKDMYDAESEWTTLEVSMPRVYNNPLLALIEKLFDSLEHIFTRELLPGIFNL